MMNNYHQISVGWVELRSCTILKNGLLARSTKIQFACGVGVPPARKGLIENGARSQM